MMMAITMNGDDDGGDDGDETGWQPLDPLTD